MLNIKELQIKGGIREGFRDGSSKLADRPCYGFSKSDDGRLVINETEAKTVRWIFERYLSGDSLGKIANGLAKQGILSPTGNEKWNRQAIDKLLSNEKYVGYALLQKTITEDGKQIRNNGMENRYLYQNNNPVIISVEIFKAVQEEKLSRSRNPEQAADRSWVMSL
jgi:hypothetical protein